MERLLIMYFYKSVRKYFLLLLAIAIIGMAAYLSYNIYDLSRNVQAMAYTLADQEEKLLTGQAEQQPEQNESESVEPVSLLIYGVDESVWEEDREYEYDGNADTIILANLEPESGNIAMLSIPRDTLATVPGYGQTKINHAHSYGGSELLVETVEDFTGRSIDYYVGFDFHIVINIIELMGGIEFFLDRDFKVKDSLLEAGQQKLDGEEAFAVIQSRQDPMGDIARVRRQQRFLEAMIGKIGSLSLEELFFLGVVTWDQVDTNLDIMTGISLADAFSDLSQENLKKEVLPGRFLNIDGISYWETDPGQKEKIINDLFETGGKGDLKSDG